MYTLLHISDLHRSPRDPVSNDELISCLLADRGRFHLEQPTISFPDAIVVSGDLIQGVQLGTSGYDEELKRQYAEALDFLVRLTDAFVSGDRSRVAIVQGNHDVDWNTAFSSMRSVHAPGQDVRGLLSSVHSSYRWSWKALSLLQIISQPDYDARFDQFRQMYRQFYEKADLLFPVDPARAWNLFVFDQGRITLCGFNSCENNDCFNLSGEISSDAISQCHLKLLTDRGTDRLRIAVWHHHVQGSPNRSDYMDHETVRVLIDKGFRLGLHGHQHSSNALPYAHYLSEEEQMVVVGAGSLCAGPYDLPRGCSRQYNVVEISDDYSEARIHVREMTVPNVFTAGRMIALGGESFKDVRWRAFTLPVFNTVRSGGASIAVAEKIEHLISSARYAEAVALARKSEEALGHYARRLITQALFKGNSWKELLAHLAHPENSEELSMLVRAHIELKDWPGAEGTLHAARLTGIFAAPFLAALADQVNVERGVSR